MAKYKFVGYKGNDGMMLLGVGMIANSTGLNEGDVVEGNVVKIGSVDSDGDVNDTDVDLFEWQSPRGTANLPVECFEAVE